VDEVHEEKSKGAAQGLAAATLAEACGKSLVLTGTLLGGYASTLFHILYRFSPGIRGEFEHGDEAKWVARYGFVDRINKKDPEERREDGRQSRRRSYATRVVERPGVTPPILFHLLGNTVFLRLRDVATNLPPFEERVMLVPLDQANGDHEQPSQAACYARLERDLKDAVRRALVAGSKRLLGAYLQSLLAWPDACTREEVVVDSLHGEIVGQAPALPADRLYPKERQLVELVRQARSRGRRVLGYVTHTGTRDLTPRLRAVLEREGFRVVVLKADTVAPDRREEWVETRVGEGVDVVLVNPRLVATGLDLVAFPEVVFIETDSSTYVLRQAARRSWRIGQHQPVTVTHLVYGQTMQADALALLAAKLRASLTVEGDLPEDGLAAPPLRATAPMSCWHWRGAWPSPRLPPRHVRSRRCSPRRAARGRG
jgi:SNF2 family DNA or RNA helicase